MCWLYFAILLATVAFCLVKRLVAILHLPDLDQDQP